MSTEPRRTPQREAFYAKIATSSLAPLWEVLKGLQSVEPRPPEAAALWHYDEVRPMLMEAGRLISAAEAERRVLILQNPALREHSPPCITHSLFAGLQLILPGEIAPSHRHTQSALRFIIEGEGAYTAVDGERTTMRPGDFVITPSWTWHDHGNETNQPMVWLDGLDLALVDLLNAVFFEAYGEDRFPMGRPEGDSIARFGSGLLPVDYERRGLTSPILNYTYERTREALERMSRGGERDRCHGFKMRYVHPATGDWAMPTMGTAMQLLPCGFSGAPYRSSDSAVFVVVEGSGRTVVNGETLAWRQHDVFVVPSWREYHHEATDESLLFSFSDRPVQEKLGLWRERRAGG
ncbi:MAG: gentisate 1,2-dioxygenase [Candidatus Binataceae bacterium]